MITLELISQTTLTADIAHFVFRPHRRVERKAGQYVVLFAPNGDARALSIASAPHEDTIEFITHISPSPYKQSLNTLEPGETATMTEPISSFLWPDSQENPLLIAGGVGVSSFRAIWRDRAHRKLDLTAELYYYAASNQFLFTEELDELTATHPEFAVHRVTSGIT